MSPQSGSHNRETGILGEDIAAECLKEKGYAIIERNFRIRGGEVDIIARDKDTFVFVEVKTRRSLLFGVPQLAVTNAKQGQILKATKFWLMKTKNENSACRFDVVAITLLHGEKPHVEHITGAFDARC